jgi:SAM-dependent methyltransferase
MDRQARERWDKRYQDEINFSQFQDARPYLGENMHLLPASGLVLDAACGLGNNAALMLDRGYNVVGVDISGIGLHRAQERLPALMAVQADLNHFEFPNECFDVILNFYFLERSLFQAYNRWLRPGGLLIFETLTLEMLSIKPDLNPDFLLKPGELLKCFQGWVILDYQEGTLTGDDKQKSIARLIARKPVQA